jgi:hypothetical protein
MPAAHVDAALRELEARRAGRVIAPSAPVVIQPQVYAPIFHPGTPLAADAERIDLDAGGTREGVDFIVDLVASARVSGVIDNPGNVSVTSTRLSLLPSGPPLPVFNFSTSADAPGPDGQFVFNGVPPGRYALLARNTPGPGQGGGGAGLRGRGAPGSGRGGDGAGLRGGGSPEAALWALADVTVRGVDVSDVRLTLRPPLTLTGRVVFDSGTLTPPDFASLRVGLTSPGGGAAAVTLADGTPMTGVAPPAPAALQQDGTFQIGGVLPGVYVPSSSVPGQSGPDGWWLRSAMLGDHDLLDRPLELGADAFDVDDIVLTFSDRHSMLSGTLSTSEGLAATDYFVVVVTTDRTLWRPDARRIRHVRPASDGSFAFVDLPAGDYVLAALTDFDPMDLSDPAFLAQLLPLAVPVAVRDGDTTTQNLAIAR